jgi:hypothetical protein
MQLWSSAVNGMFVSMRVSEPTDRAQSWEDSLFVSSPNRHHCHDSPLWAIAFLGFPYNRSFTGWSCQPHAQPPTLRTRPPYLWPPETGWPSYTPRHWVPILVAFYDTHELRWECYYRIFSNTPRHRISRVPNFSRSKKNWQNLILVSSRKYILTLM